METWSQLNTYLFLAASLVIFGCQLGRGLACFQRILQLWLIIFFSLLFHLMVTEHAAHFYSLFGSYVSGLFGTKEIIDCSETQNSPYLSCWTRSSFICAGGRARLLVWVWCNYVSLFSLLFFRLVYL
jgi:hypothetical protein